MPLVRGCNLPDDLLYDVENHTWFKEIGDGNVRFGMTTVAAALAGMLVAVTPKKVGRAVEAGKSCATIESGKWVGPAKSLVSGTVVEVNDELVAQPTLANADPYDKGWLLVLKPTNWDEVKSTLASGDEVAVRYEAKMEADGFSGCAA
jgi:glycine cleavage system H protein